MAVLSLKTSVPITMIRLVKEGQDAVVYITFLNGVEMEAIREHGVAAKDVEFHHALHSIGLHRLADRANER